MRKIEQVEPRQYEIVRPGAPYKDGETGEILGYEALYIGSTELQRTGDPATVFHQLDQTRGHHRRPPDPGRRGQGMAATFTPHAPPMPVEGSIISVLDGVSQIGQYNVVVLDRGTATALDSGSVLRVISAVRPFATSFRRNSR